MKKFYLIALAILAINFSFATNITFSSSNGKWQKATNWNLNRKPQAGDTIVIPFGKTVSVEDQQALNNVYIKVFGTLKFNNFLSYLSLNNLSSVYVFSGGKVQSTINFWQYIFIGNQTVFYANEITGPQMANAGSGSGFIAFNPLPVKFVGFTLTKKDNNALIQWSTASEMNADMHELERSFDGSNWNTIAYIPAMGTSQELNNYSYSDKNITAKVVYYRVKQVDQDGSFAYTSIRSIKNETAIVSDIKIASVENKVLLQFSKEIKGSIVVSFVSLSGQVIEKQTINQAYGQVVLTTKVKGNHIVSVSNGLDVNVTKQIML